MRCTLLKHPHNLNLPQALHPLTLNSRPNTGVSTYLVLPQAHAPYTLAYVTCMHCCRVLENNYDLGMELELRPDGYPARLPPQVRGAAV